MHKVGDQQVAIGMENIPAVVLKLRVDLFFAEMQRIFPANFPCFKERQ